MPEASPLTTLLTLAGWNPPTLGRRAEAAAATSGVYLHVHPKNTYKWLRGRRPRQPWPGFIAAALSQQLGFIVTPAHLGWVDDCATIVSATDGVHTSWTLPGALDAAHTVCQAGDVERRIFVMAGGSSLTTPAHEWLTAPGVDSVENLSGTAISDHTVNDIDTICGALRRMDDRKGGFSLLDAAQGHIRYIINLLKNGSYSDKLGRRLYSALAELLRIAGWSSFDSGRHTAAQRYWLAGLHAAHASGDRGVGANILGMLSCQAKDVGNPLEAVRIAQAACRGFSSSGGGAEAIVLLRAAEAYSTLGEKLLTEKAVDGAFAALNKGSSSFDPDWAYWMDEASAHALAGFSYLQLGAWKRAQSHLGTALKLQDSSFTREKALRYALFARAYLGDGNLDKACDVATTALDLLDQHVDSPRCADNIRGFAEKLHPYRRTRSTREFIDRLAGSSVL